MSSLKLLFQLLFCIFAFALFVTPALADDCPMAKRNKEDGKINDGRDKFTFESWIEERAKKKNAKYAFTRCIENRGTKDVWTHWKGILSAGWIEKDSRKLRATGQNSSASEERDKDLWYGDSRKKYARVKTTCWVKEEACSSPEITGSASSEAASHRTSNSNTPAQVNSDETNQTQILRKLLASHKNAVIFDYHEVFLPSKMKKDSSSSLIRMGIEIISSINPPPSMRIQYTIRITFRERDRPTLAQLLNGRIQKPLAVLNFSDSKLKGFFKDLVPIGPKVIKNWFRNKVTFIGSRKQSYKSVQDLVFGSTSLAINDPQGENVTKLPVAAYMRER